MKKGILGLLWILIIFFSYKIYDSINGPIKFNEIKNKRYADVINRLKTIRKAQIAHKDVKGVFSNNFDKDHHILFGVNREDRKKNGIYNSLVIVNNNFEIIQEYRKQKLVPFGEFLPFEKFLKKLGLKKITEGHGSFLKGGQQSNLILQGLNILPLICYEIIFTEFIQKSY